MFVFNFSARKRNGITLGKAFDCTCDRAPMSTMDRTEEGPLIPTPFLIVLDHGLRIRCEIGILAN